MKCAAKPVDCPAGLEWAQPAIVGSSHCKNWKGFHQGRVPLFMLLLQTHVLWRMLLLRKMLHAIWCDMAWLTMRADKPVHRDYWARFLRCIDILKTKKQRTVFRLTLVHGYNCRLVPTTAERECPVEVSSSSGSTSSSSRSGSTNTNRGKAAVDGASTIEGYASLVLRGEPDLIEIKGMTFCGGLDRESLSMNNVPRHQQVCVPKHNPCCTIICS